MSCSEPELPKMADSDGLKVVSSVFARQFKFRRKVVSTRMYGVETKIDLENRVETILRPPWANQRFSRKSRLVSTGLCSRLPYALFYPGGLQVFRVNETKS